MFKYIVKRVILGIVTIWAVATLTFFLMNMVPGGPFLSEKAISPQATAALEAKYGLDKPMSQRYFTYMKDALHGDFGDSLKQRGRTVTSIIISRFPVSARLGLSCVMVSLILGIPLGCIAALKRGKFADSLISVVATCGIAVPSFVICTVLMYFLGVKLAILPTIGLDVLGQDYMRTARAKGLAGGIILFKHALRNAILPVITYVGPMLAYTITGSFVVEKIFVIPGLGGEFIKAINGRDYTMIMGTTIFLATLVIIMNVFVDIAYKIVDPRIKLK